MKFNIKLEDARPLVAAASCQAVNDVRMYLNGVRVTAHKDGGLMYEATDGHRLIVVRDADAVIEGDIPEGGVILGGKIPKPSAAYKDRGATISVDGERGEIVFRKKNGDAISIVNLEVIDGQFPEFEAIVYSSESEINYRPFTANPSYLIDAAYIAVMFGGKGVTVHCVEQSNHHCGRVVFHEEIGKNILMIIMPVRLDESDPAIPDWNTNPSIPEWMGYAPQLNEDKTDENE